MNPLNIFRRRRTPLVSPDPAPEYSTADRADGLPRRAPGSSLTPSERLAVDARLDQLAAPLLVTDTGLLASLLSDADARTKGITSALAAEVHVTATTLRHGDLTGGAR